MSEEQIRKPFLAPPHHAAGSFAGSRDGSPGRQSTASVSLSKWSPISRVLIASAVLVAASLPVLAETGTPACLYVPGGYQGWVPANAPVLNPVPDSEGKYEGYVNISGTGQQYFKLTTAPDWTHTNYGNGGDGTFDTDGKAAGLTVPEGGYYQLTADLNTNRWTATKTEWSVIGNATPGGWEQDTPMVFDPEKQVWSVTVDLKKAGSFKFRANGEWKIDFGSDGAGHLQYVDNPFFAYNPNLRDITVPADGTYTVTLDLHVSGDYTYTLLPAVVP